MAVCRLDQAATSPDRSCRKTGRAVSGPVVGRSGRIGCRLGSGRLALHPKWHWKDSLPYLEPNAALNDLPPRPSLHEGLRSVLTWTRSTNAANSERFVVRLWKSDYEVSTVEGNEPIYLVSLTRERLRRGLELYALPSPMLPTGEEVESFLAALSHKLRRCGLYPRGEIRCRPHTHPCNGGAMTPRHGALPGELVLDLVHRFRHIPPQHSGPVKGMWT